MPGMKQINVNMIAKAYLAAFSRVSDREPAIVSPILVTLPSFMRKGTVGAGFGCLWLLTLRNSEYASRY